MKNLLESKKVYLLSTETHLTLFNIFEQNIELEQIYSKRKELNLYQLSELSRDLKVFNMFLLYNVRKQNLHVYTSFFKENRKMRTQITKLINKKINL